jgi:uncharacterized protein GlcG (DUF336 family)
MHKRFKYLTSIVTVVIFCTMLSACVGGGGSGSSGASSSSGLCDGGCANQRLLSSDVELVLTQAIDSAKSLGVAATFSITDRVGNVLAVAQMPAANAGATIRGGGQGGLEGATVPSVLAAISKAGTGAYLSSQGNAFSTRTASFIVQANFAPGQNNAPGGPLFGVQFSQLPCSDIKDPALGPRPLPLGLSADAGGIPLYKSGDVVGGLGIELDGVYGFDRDIQDYEDNLEEIIALAAAKSFEAPEGITAERITVGGQSLRYADLSYQEAQSQVTFGQTQSLEVNSSLVRVSPFFSGSIRAGEQFGTPSSGVTLGVRAGAASGNLFSSSGADRFPSKVGSSLAGQELQASEVNALLDSALLTANRLRAAIRQPLNTAARVSIFVVDHIGNPLGFTRSQDAPVFGIDVSLQKARTAAFFSSADADAALRANGLGSYVDRTGQLLGTSFNGAYAFSNRAIGNLSRPFYPDGINGNAPGSLSTGFPAWSPFNTGLQLDLILGGVVAPLSGSIPSSCVGGGVGRRLGNGMQIFSGSVPLYRNGILVGGLGISGDGIFQDDMIAFFGASREGLDFAGHTTVGSAQLGFNADKAIRSDNIPGVAGGTQIRFINCPESPFISGTAQNSCEDL